VERRRIGDLDVSVLALSGHTFGTQLDAEETRSIVHAAFDLGVDLVVTSDHAGGGDAEAALAPALAGIRDGLVVATTFGTLGPPTTFHGPEPEGGDPRWVRQAVDNSLRRLATDWIDLYLFDRPDPSVEIEHTLEAMHALVVAGKVRAIGVADFPVELVDEARQATEELNLTPLATVVGEYSLTRRAAEQELLGWCAEHHTLLLAREPTAADGSRTSRHEAFARSLDRSRRELELAYVLGRPEVASLVLPVTGLDGVAASVAALGWELTADERAEVEEMPPDRPPERSAEQPTER
jgi:aryl-alcohol dehydrogenase-like predicted oxidoreductase